VADEGSLCEMMRTLPEGELALYISEFLYDYEYLVRKHINNNKAADEFSTNMRKIRAILETTTFNCLKEKVPAWVKELEKNSAELKKPVPAPEK
jgi:hypothetical protein